MSLDRTDSLNRRRVLWAAGTSALGLGVFDALCRAASASQPAGPRKPCSLILLWLDGGPSQLETFDPHAGKAIAGPTRSIPTNVPGVVFAAGLPRLAEKMDRLSVIRSTLGTEVDHVRSVYLIKTGFTSSPSIVHPTLGSICAAYLPNQECELPGFISIVATTSFFSTNKGGAEAGYLGQEFNPFRIGDPIKPPANLRSRVSEERFRRRLAGLDVVERARVARDPEVGRRMGGPEQTERVVRLMTSNKVRAFALDEEPTAVRQAYGDNPFGRSCLVARRLVEVGVRCVEVQLSTWDTHVANFTEHERLNGMLDPAFAALLDDLEARELFDSTVVVCMGEFGRTPKISGNDGRDHWPYGFSVAMAGGPLRRGLVVGATDPDGAKKPVDPVSIPTLSATILSALGLDPATVRMVGDRPVKLSDGQPLATVFR
jgi:hypothetical protein